ncbi:oligosaccharide flippase family protein [Flectobacillus rivi]|uniref:Oligosaccharide flippase family protein n=1 Tax=Flectobacillus rivi TaxID=2984209 RepID=A0ABT6YWU7_9BACT|nr:oligosaccharide flippase family protein [Flectobacillus rivi]MDI9873363.1 oligosaccharide flippase family protein [Flectobacillus rivi]
MIQFIKRLLAKSLVKNFSVLAISNILIQFLTILSSIKIAKFLQPNLFGLYSLIISIGAISVVLSSLGLRNVIIRNIAQGMAPIQLLINGTLSRTLMFLLVSICIFFYIRYFSEIKLNDTNITLLYVYIFMMLHWDTMESISFGLQKMKFSAYINVTLSFVWTFVIIWSDEVYLTLDNVFHFTVIIQILKTLSYATLLSRSNVLVGSISFSSKSVLTSLKEGFPFYILAVFTLFSSQFPVMYLEKLSTSDEIAFFNISFRILSPIQLLLMTLLNSLYPNLSRLFVKDTTKFNQLIKISFFLVFILGISGALVISTFREEMVQLLYGVSYRRAADVISLQCWFTVLFGLFCLIGTILSAANKQVLLSKLSLLYAFVSVPFLLFGAMYGAKGLSIGFIVSGILNIIYHFYFLERAISIRFKNKYYVLALLIYITVFAFSFYSYFLTIWIRVGLLSIGAVIALLVSIKYKDKVLKFTN